MVHVSMVKRVLFVRMSVDARAAQLTDQHDGHVTPSQACSGRPSRPSIIWKPRRCRAQLS